VGLNTDLLWSERKKPDGSELAAGPHHDHHTAGETIDRKNDRAISNGRKYEGCFSEVPATAYKYLYIIETAFIASVSSLKFME